MIFVNSEGNVLTNNHVVNGCKAIDVKAVDSDQIPARIEAIDPKNDLATLKIVSGFGLPAHFCVQTKPAKLGETIGVIGYPLTGFLSAEPKATFGQVNSVASAHKDYTLLQISAPIQGGNSGGPVLDKSGSVIGVVVSQASMVLAAVTGNVPLNVNFAIRGELAQIFMEAHGIKYGTSDRQRKMETDEIAALGQKSTAFVVCTRE